jgi:hypothetical protein
MNVENVKLGPCNVSIDGIDIGATKGGVSFQISYSTEQTDFLDEDDNYEIELNATNVTCTVPIAETTVDNLSIAAPWATLSTSGTKRLLKINGDTQYLRQYGVAIVLTPINKTDDNEIVTIPKAVPVSVSEVVYKNSEERVYKIKFQALAESTSDNTLIKIGDPTTT